MPDTDAEVSRLVESAFDRLAEHKGFTCRPAQVHLARLISDLIETGSTGVFEAPTGLGKSLAALVPAIANAILFGKRTVVATYTNVLAEQYWRSDLPLALSLFEGLGHMLPKTELLMGRQRYACLEAIDVTAPELLPKISPAEIGHEAEAKKLSGLPARQANALWSKISAPQVCPARSCRFYNDCFYYRSRRSAEKAGIVITNHSVVIQHSLMTRREDSDGLLGDFDFLILDEAHDFPLAAQNGLEFELSPSKVGAMTGIVNRIERALSRLADSCGKTEEWAGHCHRCREDLKAVQQEIIALGLFVRQSSILDCAPESLMEHPQVAARRSSELRVSVAEIAGHLEKACSQFETDLESQFAELQTLAPEAVKMATEEIRNYRSYLLETAKSTSALFESHGVSVTYIGRDGQDPMVRQDVIGLAEPLRDLIWSKTPYAAISATLALDGSFGFFRGLTGAEPVFEEVLSAPFDYASQAAVYMPRTGRIPDPSLARRDGTEETYCRSLAHELEAILKACRGRTLALFHSRREMEAVFELMQPNPELPIHMQGKFAGGVGERFINEIHSSLFALRSFWTGFDAPGETLSCVTLVRVPFEVPVDPPQIARMAHLQQEGLNAFAEHTLPLAKMLMRQGAGRLIRRSEDRGVIALLDPRLRSKRYGEEIVANLPPGMRAFDDIADAAGFVGL